MNLLIENWYILIAIAALLITVGLVIYKFLGLPTKEQITKIKALLLLWVTEAESKLGSGTGQIKLRYVYDLFTAKFPVTAKLISFELFSLWVDEALKEMELLLKENTNVAALVKRTDTESE
jgi:amino acid permease